MAVAIRLLSVLPVAVLLTTPLETVSCIDSFGKIASDSGFPKHHERFKDFRWGLQVFILVRDVLSVTHVSEI